MTNSDNNSTYPHITLDDPDVSEHDTSSTDLEKIADKIYTDISGDDTDELSLDSYENDDNEENSDASNLTRDDDETDN